jgi:hypothetical protein
MTRTLAEVDDASWCEAQKLMRKEEQSERYRWRMAQHARKERRSTFVMPEPNVAPAANITRARLMSGR